MAYKMKLQGAGSKSSPRRFLPQTMTRKVFTWDLASRALPRANSHSDCERCESEPHGNIRVAVVGPSNPKP